jgi:hypothetical protein
MSDYRIATNAANIGMLTTQMEGVDNIRKRCAAVEVFVAHVNAGLQDLRVSYDENYEKLLKGVHAN